MTFRFAIIYQNVLVANVSNQAENMKWDSGLWFVVKWDKSDILEAVGDTACTEYHSMLDKKAGEREKLIDQWETRVTAWESVNQSSLRKATIVRKHKVRGQRREQIVNIVAVIKRPQPPYRSIKLSKSAYVFTVNISQRPDYYKLPIISRRRGEPCGLSAWQPKTNVAPYNLGSDMLTLITAVIFLKDGVLIGDKISQLSRRFGSAVMSLYVSHKLSPPLSRAEVRNPYNLDNVTKNKKWLLVY